MTAMRWLAIPAILLGSLSFGSLGVAVAQDAGSAPQTGPKIIVPNPSSVAEPVSGGGPAPEVAGGPGYPRQPTIVSSAFPDYGWLPLKYASNAAKMETFDAISPPLAWTAPPAGTAAVTLIMIDMETSSGGNPQDRLLWAVINLPPSTRLLAENTTRGRTAMLPAGAFQLSFLTNGYVGPLCRAAAWRNYPAASLSLRTLHPGQDARSAARRNPRPVEGRDQRPPDRSTRRARGQMLRRFEMTSAGGGFD